MRFSKTLSLQDLMRNAFCSVLIARLTARLVNARPQLLVRPGIRIAGRQNFLAVELALKYCYTACSYLFRRQAGARIILICACSLGWLSR